MTLQVHTMLMLLTEVDLCACVHLKLQNHRGACFMAVLRGSLMMAAKHTHKHENIHLKQQTTCSHKQRCHTGVR